MRFFAQRIGIDSLAGIVQGAREVALAVVGRYILTPKIFELLADVKPGAGSEIQLTDGISALLRHEPVFAHRFEGTRYDCGSKLGYLKANVAYGLKHPEVARAFKRHLAGLTATPRRGKSR